MINYEITKLQLQNKRAYKLIKKKKEKSETRSRIHDWTLLASMKHL